MTHTVVITDRDGGSVTLAGSHGQQHYSTLPAGILTDLPWMVGKAAETCRGADPVTLVVPSVPDLGPTSAGAGWVVKGIEQDTGWYTLTRRLVPGQVARVHLAVLDRIDPARNRLFAPGWTSDTIARHLRAWRSLTGVAWYGTAGTTAHGLMRKVGNYAAGTAPLWLAKGDLPDYLPGSLDLRWRAVPMMPTKVTTKGHRWDIRAAYLAAAAQVRLATDPPALTGPLMFDATRVGWWKVRTEVLPDPGQGPSLWEPRTADPDGTVWLTTPVLDALRAVAPWLATGPVLDSYTADRTGRHLRVWAETLRDAYYAVTNGKTYQDMPALTDAVKASYKEAVGLLNRPAGRVFRPDWRAMIIDLTRANLWRKLHRVHTVAGVWPTRIDVDSVWYPSAALGTWHTRTERPFGDLLGEGPYIGRFRYEGFTGEEGTDNDTA